MFSTNEFAIFNTIRNGITKHPLRYYQVEALSILDYIYSHSQSNLGLKQSLPSHNIEDFVKDLLDKIEDDKLAPFIGYEMATGSGKTMLMGASIYFMNKKFGVNNFLIITPASTDIYQKTIRNFQIGNFESVWADDTPFTLI
ncbi:MAG: DEAD/DEAH box helicase family protein [Ignavibacteria bacterium]|nr:DEAD/DEAH box helicase family protein [Ignavibacteria bacterium]